MDLNKLIQVNDYTWEVAPHGAMRVPAIFYADEQLVRDMDDKVYEQACNVAMLPGIVKAVYAMPDGSTPTTAVLSLPVASASTFPAVCARYSPG